VKGFLRPGETVRPKDVEMPAAITGGDAAATALPFTDVTAVSGIRFVHTTGAVGDKLLPETMGSGVSVLDFDGDGDPDLLFVNSDAWPWDPTPASRPTMALYANDGRGNFRDVTAQAGLSRPFYGMSAAIGDIDNDGDPDLFISAVGRNRLFRNDRGHFAEITEAAGVAGSDDAWSTCAGFFDGDGDGDLDLIVGGYSMWTPKGRQLTAEEEAEVVRLNALRDELQNKRGAATVTYRDEMTAAAEGKAPDSPELKEAQAAARKRYSEAVAPLNAELKPVTDALQELVPGPMRETFVWIYERK
jgi:hypothetical protein